MRTVEEIAVKRQEVIDIVMEHEFKGMARTPSEEANLPIYKSNLALLDWVLGFKEKD